MTTPSLAFPLLYSGLHILRPLVLLCFLLLPCGSRIDTTVVAADGDPDAGERKEMRFVGPDNEECTIAFRWCPAGMMKEGDPDQPTGSPKDIVGGFWISETEISQKQYRGIAGHDAFEHAKANVLDVIGTPADVSDGSPLTANQQRALEERSAAEKEQFGDGQLPIYGIAPSEAEGFCSHLGQSYERFQKATGRASGFSTYQFRLPAHFEWQYACRCDSGRKHFADWPAHPDKVPIETFTNYKDFLSKKDPDAYAKHKNAFDAFDGTEQAMVTLLEDKNLKKADKLRSQLLRTFLNSKEKVQQVDQASETAWGVKGLSENVQEWVFLVADAASDRSNVPQLGEFTSSKATCPAVRAGGWNSPRNALWQDYSIWHWQSLSSYTYKQEAKSRGQYIGIRVVMIDAVSDTWFAELRSMAEQSFDGAITPSVLEGAYESGVEVSGRDKEGRNKVQGRIGIYGALAKARSGDSKGAGKLLKDSVAALGEGGDEFFQQVSAVIQDDDLGKQGSTTQQ
jgi:formylglycine-generating enzyme required for sulfatase activity